MAIKRTIDFIDYLITRGYARQTDQGVMMKNDLQPTQLKQLKNDYRDGTISERLASRRKTSGSHR